MFETLRFDLSRGRLSGTVAGVVFDVPAESGGGGGSLIGADEPGLVNNPWKSDQRPRDGHRGGAIPPGKYLVHAPEHRAHLGWCAYLEPIGACLSRTALYIHGRGLRGSDGCVVPLERFSELIAAIGRAHLVHLEVEP